MTGNQTKEAMAAIALEKAAIYAEKLKTLDKTAKTERKALAISKQIAENCAGFVNIEFMDRFYEVREMRVYGERFHDFDEYKPLYDSLTGDDKESFLVFSFGVVMVRHSLLEKRNAFRSNGEGSNVGNAQDLFEAQIITGVIEEILRDWQKFWNENGCIACEVVK